MLMQFKEFKWGERKNTNPLFDAQKEVKKSIDKKQEQLIRQLQDNQKKLQKDQHYHEIHK